MPTAREASLDTVVLAAQDAVVERELPLAGFARLRDRLADDAGTARARLTLHRVNDVPTARLVVTAAARLVCQRCLQPLTAELQSTSDLAFAQAEGDRAPDGFEVVVGDPKRVDLAGLVEDELLLALPAIPRHAPGERCRLPAATDEAEAASEMRRPFAGLKDLLKN